MVLKVGNRPLVVGNWKMNGVRSSLGEIVAISQAISELSLAIDVVICPPTTLLSAANDLEIGGALNFGAQDCSSEGQGPFTGDVSAEMLADSGASFVILGHSERRQARNEGNGVVLKKARRAVSTGLIPIICVGETESEMSDQRTEAVLHEQLSFSVPETTDLSKLVIAYEPVWAIGTGRTPQSSRICHLHGFVRESLKALLGDSGGAVRILYGGSVTADNAREIATISHVDGALIGGASLAAERFIPILADFSNQGTKTVKAPTTLATGEILIS